MGNDHHITPRHPEEGKAWDRCLRDAARNGFKAPDLRPRDEKNRLLVTLTKVEREEERGTFSETQADLGNHWSQGRNIAGLRIGGTKRLTPESRRLRRLETSRAASKRYRLKRFGKPVDNPPAPVQAPAHGT